MKAPILLGAAALIAAPQAMAQVRSADVAARQARTTEVAAPAPARAADAATRRAAPEASAPLGLTFYDRTPNSLRPFDIAPVRSNGPSSKGATLAPEKSTPLSRASHRAQDVSLDATQEKAAPLGRVSAKDVATDATTEKATPLRRASPRAQDVAGRD